jgi:hypothetical protein
MSKQIRKINKNTIKANFRRGITFEGYISGNNVNSFHILNGWCLGMPVKCETLEELEKICRDFLWYLDKELGNRVAFWIEVTGFRD